MLLAIAAPAFPDSDVPPVSALDAGNYGVIVPSAASYPAAQTINAQPSVISLSRPGYLQKRALPGLETSITRVTDSAVFGGARRVYRHFYSKRQPWNSTGSLILLAHENTAYLLDGKTFQLTQTFTPWAEPIWSNVDPDILYGVTSSPGGLIEYRVSTRTWRVLQSFPEWTGALIGVGEGNLSDDSRYVPLVGVTQTGVDVLVYDIPNRRIVSRKAFPGPIVLGVDIDWVGMSPSGRYVVVCLNGATRAHDVYDSQTMTLVRRLTPGSVSHGDLGYDSAGNEVLVTQAGSTAISSIRLSDGVVRQELSATQMASNQHISCRNNKRPGWCYVSTYSDTYGFEKYLYREIFSLKLDGSGKIERFSQSFFATLPVADIQYSRQAHAVPNRDGTQVLFASDWGDASSSAVVHTYITEVVSGGSAGCNGEFGDLNRDGRRDVTDLVILSNYLAGNLTQGTAPFTASASFADLNGSGRVDSVDAVLLQNFLAGNVPCLPVP